MKRNQLKLCLLAAAFGLALLWATPSARANVYATNIKLNGNLTASTVGAGSGVPLTITFRLNQAATYGTVINILSSGTPVRTLTIASGSQGTLQGLNTVVWDGNDGSGNPITTGTYTISITAAAADLGAWTQISTSASTAPAFYAVAVNDNPSSPYYGRVFAGNKNGGSSICGIRKMNNDLSDADEGGLGKCNFAWNNDGYNPFGLKYAPNDQLYFFDWEGSGDIYVTDNTCSTNKHVLTSANYSGLTSPNFEDFEVMIIGNGGYFFMGDNTYPGNGVRAWPIVNGVASGSPGTQVLQYNTAAILIGDGGLAVDTQTNIYVGELRGNATDSTPRAILAGSGPWDGSAKITAAPRWGVGGSDGNCVNNYQIAINSRTNPTYLAIAIGGTSGYKAGMRVVNVSNGSIVTANGGSQVLTNLDMNNAYWGVSFDAVGNLYGCESGTSHVRAFSPPGASTNTTVAYGSVVITNAVPTITQQPLPATLTTNQGANVTYTVTASGTPTLAYQWTVNGSTISGQTGTSLALNNVQTTDSGSYAVVITNLYGSITSSPAVLTVAAKPVITQQPVPVTTYVGGVASFTVAATGSQPLSYQWYDGSSPVSGATTTALNLSNVQLTDAGTYSCQVTNTYGSTNTQSAVLTVINQTNTDGYVSTILADNPMAYYRLDETSGSIAYDFWGGHNGIYNSVVLGQPGFSCIDTDLAAAFGPGPNSYVGSITGITFEASSDTTAFSVEAWVNGPAGQASGAGIIAKGNGSGGEQFNLDVYGGVYRFFVRDSAGAIPNGTVTASVGPNGTWQHVVGVYDGPGGNYYLYVNGQQVGSKPASAAGILSSTHPISIGSRQSGSGAYDSNFKGSLDEVAIYSYALNSSQVYTHYQAQLLWPGFAPRACQTLPAQATVYPMPAVTTNFTAVAGGDPSFTYQWMLNGAPIPGANDSVYTMYGIQPGYAGTYTCAITNNYGYAFTPPAVLNVEPTNSYSATILSDNPVAYWRLDETNGTTAYDYWGGNNGTYVNASLNQPGYDTFDPDAGIGVPADGVNRGYVLIPSYSNFVFSGNAAFTFEAWVNFSNAPSGVERLFSTMRTNISPHGYGFGVSSDSQLVFTTAGVADTYGSLPNNLVAGQWYYLACTCDGGSYNFYVNGVLAATAAVSSGTGAGVPLSLGNNTTWPYSEQINGRLDEMAVYNNALSADRIWAHYIAPPHPPGPVAQIPLVQPQGTNYVSLTSTLVEYATGLDLLYQWYKAPSTLIPGATDSALVIGPLAKTDAGSYYVHVSNPGGSTNTPAVPLVVWDIPTNATQLNFTNSLVLHLPFDTDYNDISGLEHNGTAVGTPALVPGVVGGNALSYSTDTNADSYNYVTLGVVPDLEFGLTTDFTVSYWVQLQPAGALYGNLPFFTIAVGSTGHGGFAFAPGLNSLGYPTGGWGWTIGGVTVPGQFNAPNVSTINDGNWHHLVHVAQRSANCTTYLDGKQVDSTTIIESGDITMANAATIGQDPTGSYGVTAGAYIDDLAVWTNALTQLQISGMYLAGVSNAPGVSFAPAIAPKPHPVEMQVVQVGAQWQIQWAGGVGTLWSAPAVNGPWTAIQTNAASPYTIPMATPGTFYRLK